MKSGELFEIDRRLDLSTQDDFIHLGEDFVRKMHTAGFDVSIGTADLFRYQVRHCLDVVNFQVK